MVGFHGNGIEALLVEGGGITALQRARLVDRMITSIAAIVIDSGVSAVGELDIARVVDGISLTDRTDVMIDDDVLIAGNVDHRVVNTATVLGGTVNAPVAPS